MDTPSLSTLPESLTIRSRHPSGAVTAVHVWESGWQTLEFENIAHFERVRKSIDVRNAGMLSTKE